MANNPRRANGWRRDKARQWVLATQDMCAICGQPVDKSLKHPHPLSPEVDEVIPVSRGGSPTEKNNIQLAHRICNQRRGARPLAAAQQQLVPPAITSRSW